MGLCGIMCSRLKPTSGKGEPCTFSNLQPIDANLAVIVRLGCIIWHCDLIPWLSRFHALFVFQRPSKIGSFWTRPRFFPRLPPIPPVSGCMPPMRALDVKGGAWAQGRHTWPRTAAVEDLTLSVGTGVPIHLPPFNCAAIKLHFLQGFKCFWRSSLPNSNLPTPIEPPSPSVERNDCWA